MLSEFKKWCMYTFVSIGLCLGYVILQAQKHKIAIMVFAFLILCKSVLCVSENKKLSLRSIKLLQILAFGSGCFLMSQFWIMLHDKYEYFFLIIVIFEMSKINEEFENAIKRIK